MLPSKGYTLLYNIELGFYTEPSAESALQRGLAGRPGGVSDHPRAWYISQFREFEPPRVHTRVNSWDFLLCTN